MSIFGGSYSSVLPTESDPTEGAGLISIQGETNFPVIFTGYNRNKTEKAQVIEAFGENIHLYAFGSNAETLNLTGHILATAGSNNKQGQASELLFNKYNESFRAFQLAKQGNLITVVGPGDFTFTGVSVGINIAMTSDTDSVMNFQINMFGVDGAAGVATGASSGGGSGSLS